MKCPVCTSPVDLVMTERQGVEIDYCPKCRGVWLDRGELDKIVELSIPRNTAGPDHNNVSGRDDDFDDDNYRGNRGNNRRRESFLGDLFDF